MYWLGGAHTGMIAPIVGALRQQNGYRGLLNPFGINPLRGVLDGLLNHFQHRGFPPVKTACNPAIHQARRTVTLRLLLSLLRD
jgi:hypothetical protein